MAPGPEEEAEHEEPVDALDAFDIQIVPRQTGGRPGGGLAARPRCPTDPAEEGQGPTSMRSRR